MKRYLLLTCLSTLLLPAAVRAQEEKPAADDKQAALEKEFAEKMNGVVLAGSFTTISDGKTGAPKEERYTISSVKKLGGDLWLFNVRIQYGGKDKTLPLPLPIKWAGDTPMISMTNLPVPGFGTFSARVVFYGDKYAGTWSAPDHGGHLFGRIEKAKVEEDAAKE